MQAYPPPIQRVWNRRPWRANPLMRAEHRAAFSLNAVVADLIALTIPVAVGAAAGAAYTRTADRAHHPPPGVHTVDATLDSDADTVMFEGRVPAHWSVDGRTHSGAVAAEATSRKGDLEWASLADARKWNQL